MNATQQLHDNAMSPRSDKFYSARIVERRDISSDLWIIRVDPGGEYCYEAGQYATLGVVTPEKHYERAYSIVSAPHEKLLEFFVELVPQGDLTPRLYQDRVGDEFTLRIGDGQSGQVPNVVFHGPEIDVIRPGIKTGMKF